ncbi:hypothetical protein Tco_1386515 [Tanacetum coccineum]
MIPKIERLLKYRRLQVNAKKDPLTFDELMATPIDFSKFAMNRLKLDKITKADTNPEGDKCLYNLSKPLPLQGSPGHLTIHVNFFFNNDLEYLRTRNSERKYIVSITKTKAARRADRKLYTFKEGDFPRLHLNDIKDMLLFHVQNKLYNLEGNDIVDLAVVLCMFTQSLVIKKRVEDVQFSVESYQKKLNTTKPQKDFPGISAKEPYTTSHELKGVVYLNSSKCKRLMQADEIYKEQAKYNETNAYVLEDSILQARNPVKEILLKLNLPDHRYLQRWRASLDCVCSHAILAGNQLIVFVAMTGVVIVLAQILAWQHDTVFAAMLNYASTTVPMSEVNEVCEQLTLTRSGEGPYPGNDISNVKGLAKPKKVIKDRRKKEKTKEFTNAKNPQRGRVIGKKNHVEIVSGFKEKCFIDFVVMEVKLDQETSTREAKTKKKKCKNLKFIPAASLLLWVF